MSTRAVEQVDDWETRSFSGGYRGLHDLADDGFSGIVTVGPTRLCMTKGTVVGILDGSIEDFEDASGTAHEAPSPALPLLAVMQEGTNEVRAQYYTEETPIREVDSTLSDGNFTGFIELSENVLSGDYYVVYHQGRSMAVAYVGNAKQLLTEGEAFQRANDEVGIYEVIDAEVDVIEIPDAGGSAGADAGAAAGAAAAAEASDTDPADASAADTGTDSAANEPAEPDTSAADESTTADRDGSAREPADPADAGSGEREQAGRGESGSATDSGGEPADRRAESEPSGRAARDESRTDEARTSERSASRADDSRRTDSGRRDEAGRGEQRREEPRTEGRTASESVDRGQSRSDTDSRSTGRESTGGTDPTRRESTTGGRGRASGSAGTPTSGGARQQDPGPANNAVGSGTVSDLETRSIPSLDPDRTSEPEQETPAGGAAAGGAPPQPEPEPRGGTQERTPTESQGTAGVGGAPRGQPDEPQRDPRGREQSPPADTGELADLEAELDEREAEIDRLEAELDERDERIDDLEAELEDVRAERDDLQVRLERMEDRIDDLRTGEGGESVADRQRMGPGEAIDGTNLFIRYASKGDATLENAHDGSATAEDVNGNLEVQYHTQFDAGNVAVDGEPFDDFLESTIQYRFVEWVVRVLPYEIRDTGHEGALKDLYDAMPRLDRAELNGVVSVVYEEDGEEQRSQETFDVVLRDRMGNPLAVANMNESRDPASQGMMEGLITAARRVSESKESLAGAFLVTSSFFEPEAMEAASQATGGGLLSRDKRESFVKLSRKEGFHLCLVEAREAQFNLSVPEI